MDSYLCLIHLAIALFFEGLFHAFTIASFFKFTLFTIFEMRYLLLIWKSRRPQNFGEWGSVRQEFQTLYTRFCYKKKFFSYFIF